MQCIGEEITFHGREQSRVRQDGHQPQPVRQHLIGDDRRVLVQVHLLNRHGGNLYVFVEAGSTLEHDDAIASSMPSRTSDSRIRLIALAMGASMPIMSNVMLSASDSMMRTRKCLRS